MKEWWLSQAHWEEEVRRPSFHGNPQQAVGLMMQLVKGMEWVRGAVKNELVFTMPSLHLADGSPELAHYKPVANAIFANRSGLEKMSKFKKSDMLLEKRGQSFGYQAVADDKYFLMGIEEADHARFHQQYGATEHPLDPDTVGVEAYDAQPHEYEALVKQYEAACSLDMSKSIIRVLEMRICAAELVREAMTM